jgi:CheY-like chemotaxis protein
MAAALGIVRGHKGAILLESEVGKGSTFRVFLPVATGEVRTGRKKAGRVELKGRGKVLVVDDENVVRQAAANALAKYGYQAVLAENGLEAVEVFREQSELITLILLDMTMPYMSGEETLERLRQIRHDVPVIASSGYNEATADERFRGKRLAGFIQKPYTAAKLAEKIKDALKPPKSIRRAGAAEDS